MCVCVCVCVCVRVCVCILILIQTSGCTANTTACTGTTACTDTTDCTDTTACTLGANADRHKRTAQLYRLFTRKVGQNHIYTVHIRYFLQGIYQIYGHIRCIYTVLANPIYTQLACCHARFKKYEIWWPCRSSLLLGTCAS